MTSDIGEQHKVGDARRVAIVGAGVSGLAAATSLVDRGYPVTVFDKGRGVGGRTAVRRSDEFFFDHGAQYFTVRDKAFRRHVDVWLKKGIEGAFLSGLAAATRIIETRERC